MPDVLTIRVCGVDREPLPVPFNVKVYDWHTGRKVGQALNATTAVDVPDVSPTGTYRAEVLALGYRMVSAHVLGLRTVDVFCPIDPDSAEAEWPATYPDELLKVYPADQIAILGDLPRAGLLNIYTKLAQCDLWQHVLQITEVRRDRIFAIVRADLRDTLALSAHFELVSGSLHACPEGFEPAGSFKERDVPAGGLQVTLFCNGTAYRADIDIDDAAGIGHAGQVIKHAATGGSTHPYDIHQALVFQGLNPGYRLVA